MPAKFDLELYESHNVDEYKHLIKALDPHNTTELAYRKELQGILRSVKENRIAVRYCYKLKGQEGNYGRLYATGKCYQTMSNVNRQHFSNFSYIALDLNNCHPNLLNQLCRAHKIDCPELSEYCENRAQVLEDFGISKQFVNKLCNTEIFSADDLPHYDTATDFFKNIHDAVYKSLLPILKAKEPDLFKATEKHKKDVKYTNYNINGAFIANYLMTLERDIILACKAFLEGEGFSVDALIHDEILVKKDKEIGPELLQALNAAITNTTFRSLKLDFDLNFKLSKSEPYKVYEDAKFRHSKLKGKVGGDAVDLTEAYEGTAGVDHDMIGKLLFDAHKDSIRKVSDTCIFIKKNAGIWAPLDADGLNVWIAQSSLRDASDKNASPIKLLTKNWAHYRTQIKIHITSMLPDSSFLNELDNYIGYLPFIDGVYSFVDGRFYPRGSEGDCFDKIYASKVVERKFPSLNPDKIGIIKDTIEQIFNYDGQAIDEIFSAFARALAGHYNDKVWLSLTGMRNSAKSWLVLMFIAAFNKFVGGIDSKDLILKKHEFASSDRANHWKAALVESRICFASESKVEGLFDGTEIKSAASGGDFVPKFRDAYGQPRSGYARSLLCIVSQCLPRIEPIDALQNCLSYEMPCRFVSDPSQMRTDDGYVYHLSDPKVGEYCKDEEFICAFIHFVLGYYKPQKPLYAKLIEGTKTELEETDEAMSDFDVFKGLFDAKYVVSADPEARIKASQVQAYFKARMKSSNAKRIRKFLDQVGAVWSRRKDGVYYSKIAEIDKDSNSDCGFD